MTPRTAAPSSSGSHPKCQERLTSIQPLASIYSLALNAVDLTVTEHEQQVVFRHPEPAEYRLDCISCPPIPVEAGLPHRMMQQQPQLIHAARSGRNNQAPTPLSDLYRKTQRNSRT